MRLAHRSALIAAALGIGALFPIGANLIFASALNRQPDWSEPDVILVNALLASVPFVALAMRSSVRFLAWLITFGATAWLNWWWVSKGIAYQRAPDGSGVDMGGAFIMLFSPLPLSALAVGIDFALGKLTAPRTQTPAQVATALRNFIDGTGGAWDFDDFISQPLSDPRLDSIRHRASVFNGPKSVEGLARLRELLAEAEMLSNQEA